MRRTLGLVSLLSILVFSPLALGQSPADSDQGGTGGPVAIEAADIPLAAERVRVELEFKKETLESSTAESSLEAWLEDLGLQGRTILDNPSATRPEELNLRARDRYRDRWLALKAESEKFERALDKQVSGLQKERDQLKALTQTWEATLQAYPGKELAPALRERVNATLALTQDLDKLYAQRLTSLSQVYRKARSESRVLDDVLKRFAAAEKTTWEMMFSKDSPPIWRVLDTPSGEPGAVKTREKKIALAQSDLRVLFSDYRMPILIHGLVSLAFLGLTLPLARRRKQWKETPYLAQAVKLFATPVSLALLMGLLFSSLFIATIPLRILDLRATLLALLTLRVMSQVFEGRIRKMLYLSVGLMIAAKLTDMTADFSLAERFGLLVLNLAAIAFMNYLGRALPSEPGQHRWWAWARILAKITQPLLAVALVSNLLGNVSLAQAIVIGVIYSTMSAVILASGVLILEAMTLALLQIQGLPQPRALQHHRDVIQQRLFKGIRVLAFLAWIYATVRLFRVGDWLTTHLVQWLTYRVQLGNLDLAAMDIIAFVGTVYVATLLSRFVRFVLDEEVFPRVTLGRGLPSTISVLANYIILTLGFFIAISVAGIDLSRLTIVLGALSVGIGFGLQNVVNNFVSGLILVFERPIQVGDTIEVGQLLGHVKRIGFRSSTVRTYDGAEVIVPNGNLISSEVVNWTLSDRNRRLVIPVGVAYGSDPEQVLEILNATVMDHQSVLKYPKPVVIFTGFGDSALQFSVRVWVSDFEESFRITSDLSVMIYAALNKAGIEIPFPQRDLHLRSVAPGISLSAPAKGMPGDEPAEKSAD